jgi:diguanylate cyclase (GGDEF)-like protein
VDELDPIPAPRKFGNGWTEYVIRTKEPMLLSQENVRRLEQEEGVKTFGYDSLDWLGVPLKVEDRLIGIVAVQSYSEGVRYTEVEKNILTFVSSQIAMVIDRKRTEQELKYSSLHDPLTGLYNRGYFEEEVKRLNSGRQSPVGVIMVDMDNLKVTNDTYGHDAGDALIKAFARELMNSFRSNDVVARLGGDEFGVLLPVSPLIVVEKAVERLQVKVDESNKSNPKFPIKYSLGYHTNEDGCSFGEALKIADQRMYVHKSLNKLSPEE